MNDIKYYKYPKSSSLKALIARINGDATEWSCISETDARQFDLQCFSDVFKRKDLGFIAENLQNLIFIRKDQLSILSNYEDHISFNDLKKSILKDITDKRIVAAVEFEVKLEKSSNYFRDNGQEKKVLFFSPYGDWVCHGQLDAILAKSLSLRGVPTKIMRCDGVFKNNCYVLTHSRDHENDCNNCKSKGDALFEAFGLETSQIRHYIVREDWQEAYQWVMSLDPKNYRDAVHDGLEIGKWITPIVCSNHMISEKNLYLDEVRATHRQYLMYSLVCYRAMERVFDEFQPSNVVVCAGGGMIQDALMALCKRRNIQVLAHANGRVEGSFIFTANEITSAFASRFEIAKAWETVPLNQDELDKIVKYIEERQQGKNHNFMSYYSFKTEESAVKKKLNIPDSAKIFSVFTSSEYEKIYFKEYDNLPSQIELIDRLITIFKDRNEYLVIRHHPNIGGGTRVMADKDFLTEIYKMRKNLPENVRIIMPHEELTSYALLWNTEACISFFSTVGLEAVAAGVPSAICEECLYSPGATHKIQDISIEGLRATVEELLEYRKEFSESDLKKLYRFLNAFIFKFSHNLNSCKATNNGLIDVRIKVFEELLPGNDQGLDRIIDHILTGSSLLIKPTNEDYRRDPNVERVVIQSQLERIKEFKKVVGNSEIEKEEPKLEVILLDYVQADFKDSSDTVKSSRTNYERFSSISVNGNSSWVDTAKQIKKLIEVDGPEYVHIASSICSYDEHFALESLHQLHNVPNADSILSAAWRCSKTDDIRGAIFSDLDLPFNYEKMEKSLNIEANPLQLLHLCIIRRSILLPLLAAVIENGNARDCAREIFNFFTAESSIQKRSPALWFRPYSYPDLIDYSFEAQGRPFKFGVKRKAIITGFEEEAKSKENTTRIVELSVTYLNSGSPLEAAKMIDIAIRHNPELPDLKLIKAYAQKMQGENKEAVETLDQILITMPQHLQAQELKAEILKSQASS